DPDTFETVRKGAHDVLDITFAPIGGVRDTSHRVSDHRSRGHAEHALDLVLQSVLEFLPTPGEELDAVVPGRVVAGREHHTEVGPELTGQVRHRGCGQHTD